MAIADFLFQGQPPPATTTYGTATQNVPQWYADYTQGVASKANAIAAEPYVAYGGPRIANFTGDQTNAQQGVRDAQGAFNPTLQGGINTLTNSITQSDPLPKAMPFINKSNVGANSVVGDYMNPYTDQVVDRIGALGARNLSEKLMPAIGSDFIAAGQYGSQAHMRETGKALRDVSEGVLAQQADALQTGYGQSMSQAQNDLSRFGNLGQVVGNLASTQQGNMIDVGRSMTDAAKAGQDMRYTDLAQLDTVGGAQRALTQQNLDMAYGDFIRQRDYGKEQLGFLNNAIRGFEMPTSTTTSATAPASTYQASPLAQGLGIAGALSSLTG